MDGSTISSFLRRIGCQSVRIGPKWVQANCPLAEWTHSKGADKSPSFGVRISSTNSVGHCFTCKRTGPFIAILKEIETKKPDLRGIAIEAVREEAKAVPQLQYERDEEDPIQVLDVSVLEIYPDAWYIIESKEYLENRGIGMEAAYLLRMKYHDVHQRILFPVIDSDDTLYGFTGRTVLSDVQPKYRDYEGLKKSEILYGDDIREVGKPIVVVEGAMDLARCVQNGICRRYSVVSLLGTNISIQQLDMLTEYDQPVYLFLDNDDAGDQTIFGGNGKLGAAVSFTKRGIPVYIPEYPDGKNDPGEMDSETMFSVLDRADRYGMEVGVESLSYE